MSSEAVFEGLNAEQRRAVECLHGPLCILAGAGSGKTTTITRRIAHQVVSGEFEPKNILAVTFTTKAAGELAERLARLGAPGVPAKTFHAAALSQLAVLGGRDYDVVPSKIRIVAEAAQMLPAEYRSRPLPDLAQEIERAKNRRVPPERYAAEVRDGPLPAELMAKLYGRYEKLKAAARKVDFEDLLDHAIAMYETDDRALARFKARYLAVTVDEYQDVNLLQQTLLERWLDGRDELCVVGDDYQAIYSFTGATPHYLLEMPLPAALTVIVHAAAFLADKCCHHGGPVWLAPSDGDSGLCGHARVVCDGAQDSSRPGRWQRSQEGIPQPGVQARRERVR